MPAPAAGGKRLFGLPRNVAIIAIAAGFALVAYFWWRSRQNQGAAGLPASASLPSDGSTAAPSLGGTPDSGSAAASQANEALLAAFTAQENLIGNAFGSQQQLIAQLAGGYEQLAMTSEQQLGALAASALALLPAGSGGGGGTNRAPAGAPVTQGAPQPLPSSAYPSLVDLIRNEPTTGAGAFNVSKAVLAQPAGVVDYRQLTSALGVPSTAELQAAGVPAIFRM